MILRLFPARLFDLALWSVSDGYPNHSSDERVSENALLGGFYLAIIFTFAWSLFDFHFKFNIPNMIAFVLNNNNQFDLSTKKAF